MNAFGSGITTEAAETLVERAFHRSEESALEDVHRLLYGLYAERIWRQPSQSRDGGFRAESEAVQDVLERGFLRWLERRREGVALPAAADAAEFEQLALGPQPFEDEDWGRFVREEISLDGLKSIVAQRSLFFLREPDPWIYAVPTLTGVAKAGLIDLLLDEYGWGKLERMHSSVYARLMAALGLDPRLDAYESRVSWQFLATLNHQWMLALRPGLARRLLGVVYLTESGSPGAMRDYLAAWARLGIDDREVLEFYEIHVSADENHSQVALDEVVLPVCAEDPAAITEIAKGIVEGRILEADFAATIRAATVEPAPIEAASGAPR